MHVKEIAVLKEAGRKNSIISIGASVFNDLPMTAAYIFEKLEKFLADFK